MLASCKNIEEKAKKAMVDAWRLADELRSEQDHANAQEKAKKTIEVSLCEMQKCHNVRYRRKPKKPHLLLQKELLKFQLNLNKCSRALNLS